jgi:hypothetical protein
MINLDFYNSTSGKPRNFETLNISDTFEEPAVKVKRLTGPDTSAKSSVSWAGQAVDGLGVI